MSRASKGWLGGPPAQIARGWACWGDSPAAAPINVNALTGRPRGHQGCCQGHVGSSCTPTTAQNLVVKAEAVSLARHLV